MLKEDVLSFLRRLAPESRRAVKVALKDLRSEKGDIRSLEYALTGYHRLRVGKFRVIFRYRDGKTIDVIFAAERSIVYEVFEEQLAHRLKTGRDA